MGKGTEFERWFETEWPAMMEPSNTLAPNWEIGAAILWERTGAKPDHSYPSMLEQWRALIAQTTIPPEAWSHPAVDPQYSWDRRAAWLVYSLLSPLGKTLNESSDLFG